MKTHSLLVLLTLTAVACASPVGTGVGGGGGGGVDAGADGSSGGGTSGGGTSGDNTKNSATLTAKDDSGKSADVKRDKPATKDDADKKVLGAASAGDVLSLFITDATGTVIVAYIDTKKHPLPAKGIPVGAPNGDAWVTYTGAGAVLNSKDTGTIDIDTCPTKDGLAVVGKFNGVVVVNEAPIGPKTMTLDGPFNLVYFAGAGALTCKPASTSGGGTSGGSSGGGSVDLGVFGKPSGASCDANPCDGGSNTTRNCCPYIPCLNTCFSKCVTEAQTCFQSCGFDFECPQKCTAAVYTCQAKCLVTCEVSGGCKTALEALGKCEESNAAACDNEDEAKADACLFDKCCTETKAAF